MNDDEDSSDEKGKTDETREERLKRLLRSRTKKARKRIHLIGNLTSANYKCPKQKEYLLKAIHAIDNDLKELRTRVETGEEESKFDIDL